MSPLRAYYVTACQQLLALGVVVIALVPATRVVSLDVVGVGPGHGVAQPTISVSPDQPVGQQTDAAARFGRSSNAHAKGRCATRNLRVVAVGSRAHAGDRACRTGGRTSPRSTPPGGG